MSDNLEEDEIIAQAMSILMSRILSKNVPGVDAFTSTDIAKKYLQLKIAHFNKEVFGVLFLDNQNKLIADEILFQCTINSVSDYPRDVLRKVVEYKADAVMFYHNHLSGIINPSLADRAITDYVKSVLSQVGVRTLDHFIIGNGIYSFAENGLI